MTNLKFQTRISNLNTQAIIDAGADINLVTDTFLRKIGAKKWKSDKIIVIRDVGGKKTVLNHVTLINFETAYQKFVGKFHVLVGDHFDILLGREFLKAEGAIMDFGNITLNIKGIQYNLKQPESIEVPEISTKELKRLVQQGQIIDVALAQVEKNNKETETEREESQNIIKQYKDIFREDMETLPTEMALSRQEQMEINLVPDATPKWRPTYRLSDKELQEMRRQVDVLLNTGKITPSASPYGAPILFVKKKSGELRMCVDYRALNSQTIRDRYALPRIDELLDRVGHARYFSKLDLTSGYYQIGIKEKDRYKTAFNTRYGSYEYKVMPFGLTNAPAVFQRIMNKMFHQELDKFVVVYLDDILVFSNSKEDHQTHLRHVFQKLRDNEFFANLKKCEFFKDQVEFLGHVIQEGTLKPNPTLTAKLREFPLPKTVKEVQQFLGLANYYRRFIPKFSELAAPLSSVTGKPQKQSIELTSELIDSVNSLKELLLSAPVLVIPDPNLPPADRNFYFPLDTIENDGEQFGNGLGLRFQRKQCSSLVDRNTILFNEIKFDDFSVLIKGLFDARARVG